MQPTEQKPSTKVILAAQIATTGGARPSTPLAPEGRKAALSPRLSHRPYNLVVGDGVEEVVVAGVQAGVHHAAGDTKHGGTSVLDLNIEGTVTGLRVFDLARVSSGDGSGGSVVTSRKVLGSSGVFGSRHGDKLSKSSEKGDLDKSEGRDGGKGRDSHTVVHDGGERNFSLKVKGSREGNSEFLDQHTDEGNHGDTSVLDFDGTTTGEGVGVLHESKGIEEVEGSGVDSEAIGGAGITVDGGGDASSLGRREGDGGGGEGGGDDKLHDCCFVTGSSLQQLMERRKRNGSGETIDQKDAQ